jgi:hypothetical protein
MAVLLDILSKLLAGVNSTILPQLRFSQAMAEMFGAVSGILTKGTYPADTWADKPGVQVANQETMGNFFKAWLFFLAADGQPKPDGISDAQWKQAVEMARDAPLDEGMMESIRALLKDPAFQTLFNDVKENSDLFAAWEKLAGKRAGLFSGADRKEYDRLQAEIEAAQQEEFETDPKDRGELKEKIAKLKAEQRQLAEKSGVNMGLYDQITADMEESYEARLAIMVKVRDEDVPAIQLGRTPVEGSGAPIPTDTERKRYDSLTNDATALSARANSILDQWKVRATLVVKQISQLAPLISKFLKSIQKTAKGIQDRIQS